MFYLVRCPVCENSETEKIDKEDDFKEFKCCDCGQKFSPNEAIFDEIDDYEIRRPLILKSRLTDIKTVKVCNHKSGSNNPTIEYDSNYEMKSSEMHCSQCGKSGTREELLNEVK